MSSLSKAYRISQEYFRRTSEIMRGKDILEKRVELVKGALSTRLEASLEGDCNIENPKVYGYLNGMYDLSEIFRYRSINPQDIAIALLEIFGSSPDIIEKILRSDARYIEPPQQVQRTYEESSKRIEKLVKRFKERHHRELRIRSSKG